MSSSTVCEKPTLAATPDQAARLAGILLLLTAIVRAVMVYARMVSGTDQETLLESSRAVAANQGMCGLFGVARLVSGLTLLAAGWFLLRTWIIRDRWATSLVPYLFTLSGICTVASGAAAVVTAFQADALIESLAEPSGMVPVDYLRWLAGTAGFSAAGLALMVAAWYQWRVGGTLRKVAPASAVLEIRPETDRIMARGYTPGNRG